MKQSHIITAIALATTLGFTARADTAKFDGAMTPVVAEYLKIQKALAGDSEKGVSAEAKKIVKLAGKVATASVTGEHAEHYKVLAADLKKAAGTLAAAKGIDARREAFKAVSKPMTMWAKMSKPAGIYVAFCPMVKESWLQADKTIANPYYGSKMLTCGEITSGPEAMAPMDMGGEKKGHMDMGGEKKEQMDMGHMMKGHGH